ncbi:MAG: sodium:proton antiporter [Phycisphaerales bacterium]|nr:sodium:proton antiporter [Phycisphaerales bacterium]
MLALAALWPLGTAPFVGLLVAIAVLPLSKATASWWHSNVNKGVVAAVCALLTCIYLLMTETPSVVAGTLQHTLLDDYIPFIVLLGSLYIVAGGIAIRGEFTATTCTNTVILACGTLLASVLGTTGASVLLIRVLLQTNQKRTRVAHTVVFFIFLVSNVGGTLLPIGDPPLFLGYLRGVPFFWTLSLWKPWLFTSGSLLLIYFVIDSWMARRESPATHVRAVPTRPAISALGLSNVVWLGGILASVVVLVPGRLLPGTLIEIPQFAREAAMCLFALASLATTRSAVRAMNEFAWGPIVEVACLFAGIFVTMQVPLAVLAERGASLGLSSPVQYFWATGGLSGVLDNAPTYLVFLTTAATVPIAPGAATVALAGGTKVAEGLLAAVSLGAVFMGAITYIGNGPNFMVKAMAEQSGVRMPSFFGYMGWAFAILIPLFVAVSAIFF